MAKRPESPAAGERNLVFAVAGILALSALTSVLTAKVADDVLAALNDANTMALFITDDGIKADNASSEETLNSAISALRVTKDLAVMLSFGCLACVVGLAFRVTRRKV